jgi:hypothetical protein
VCSSRAIWPQALAMIHFCDFTHAHTHTHTHTHTHPSSSSPAAATAAVIARYVLLLGKFPFRTETYAMQRSDILCHSYESTVPPSLGPIFRHVFTLDANTRPTASAVLEHHVSHTHSHMSPALLLTCSPHTTLDPPRLPCLSIT